MSKITLLLLIGLNIGWAIKLYRNSMKKASNFDLWLSGVSAGLAIGLFFNLLTKL